MRRHTGRNLRMVVSCPAGTLKSVWAKHIATWIQIDDSKVLIVDSLATLERQSLDGIELLVITRNLVACSFARYWSWVPDAVMYYDKAGRTRFKGDWRLSRQRGGLFAQHWDLLVIDESQYLRNFKPRAVTIAGHNHLGRRCKQGIICTATPVCNRPSDLCGQLKSLAVEYKGNPDLCTVKGWHGSGGFRTINPEASSEFLSHSFRMTEDILNLPVLTHEVVEFKPKMCKAYRDDYNLLLEEAKDLKAAMDQEGSALPDMAILMAILHSMRQMIVHRFLFETGAAKFTQATVQRCIKLPSTMMTTVADLVEDLISSGHRQIVIFGLGSNSVMPLIKTFLESKIDAWFGIYKGGMSQKQRAQCTDYFLGNTPDIKILFIQIQAGGVGLNLVPGPSVAIFIEQAWSPAEIIQAYKRIHRIGQTNPVKVFHVIGTGTVDNAIHLIHEDKTIASQAILEAKKIKNNEWKVKGRAIDLCEYL